MNAKDTLKAIAEALNIVSTDAKEVTADVAIENAPEVVAETTEEIEVTPEVKEVETEVIKDETEVVEVKEDASETIEPTPEPTPEVNDSRVSELEKQLADLKEILKNAMTEPEVVEAPIVEAPEPKGLTHSPEAPVAKKAASGVGRKGGSIQERVNRYINNN